METTSIRFADAARKLGEAARRQGLVVPAFRSPPRSGSLSRSIRRRADGSATVSVALRGRPWPAVLADLIEGVIATNQLEAAAAADARDVLWAAAAGASLVAGPAVPAASAAVPAGPAVPVGAPQSEAAGSPDRRVEPAAAGERRRLRAA